MPRSETDDAYLRDMLRHAYEVVEVTDGMSWEAYRHDRMRQLVVERLLHIIGEAANRTSPDARAAFPDAPWARIIAQRHVIAHEYGKILHDRLWTVATVYIPQLIQQPASYAPALPEPSQSGWENER